MGVTGRVSILMALLALAGCGKEERVTRPRSAGGGTVASKPQVKLREVIGKRTTDIKDARVELSKEGARIGDTKIVAKDPITLQGNAYVSMIGQTSILQIQHALDLYHAQYDRYPATLQEFMDEIIKPNGIALPTLPFYQEYGYDAPNHRLVILEYPDRKAQFDAQQDARFGR